MKSLHFIILFIAILSFSCTNSSDDKDRINASAIKIKNLDITADEIYQQNALLIKESNSAELEKSITVFEQFDDSLQIIRGELISATGGYTREGYYFNAPAFNYVEDYFYGQTAFRDNSHEFFFSTLTSLERNLKQLSINTELLDDFNSKIDDLRKHNGLSHQKDLFKNMSIDEAVELIEAVRRHVALGHQKFLISEITKSKN